jgi:preprotein translocase subunit YajC
MHPILDSFLAQTADGQSGSAGLASQALMFLSIILVVYFIVIRPQSKQRKKLETFLQGLKRGDEVVTQSGIIGEVVAVEDRVVTLNVGGGTKLRVLKGQVAGQWVEGAAPAAEKK